MKCEVSWKLIKAGLNQPRKRILRVRIADLVLLFLWKKGGCTDGVCEREADSIPVSAGWEGRWRGWELTSERKNLSSRLKWLWYGQAWKMKCRYFYGNNSQCLVKNCIREDIGKGTIGKDAGLIATGENKEDMCRGCPYRQQGGYCFPCMKKLLKRKETDKQAG